MTAIAISGADFLLISAVAFLPLLITAGVAHPAHAFAAILAFALIYIGIGTLVDSFVSGALEGLLTVAFVFLIDAFSGPGMSDSGVAAAMPTRKAADLLIDAGAGSGSPVADWIAVGLTALGTLLLGPWPSGSRPARGRDDRPRADRDPDGLPRAAAPAAAARPAPRPPLPLKEAAPS